MLDHFEKMQRKMRMAELLTDDTPIKFNYFVNGIVLPIYNGDIPRIGEKVIFENLHREGEEEYNFDKDGVYIVDRIVC